MTTQLINQLTELEKQTAEEQDAAFVRLTVDVANSRITEPETIHAALRTLGRDSADLQRTLSAYAAVRQDFDIFARLGERSEQLAASEQEARDANARLNKAAVDVSEAKRRYDLAELALRDAERAAYRMKLGVTESQLAGERLMSNPRRLRFLPESFRTLMTRVESLRVERVEQDRQRGELRQLIDEAKERIAFQEPRIRYWQSRDYWICNPPLDQEVIKKRIVQDQQEVANAQSAIDNDNALILQWRESLDTANTRFDALTIELDAARAELAAALNSK